MNEHRPSPERTGRHAKPTLSLDQLPVTDSDPVILALWDEGLTRWGEAFAAYTTLGVAELHTSDVLTSFEDLYVASFDNMTDLVNDQLQALGWDSALGQFRAREGIAESFLVWDENALTAYIGEVYDIVRIGGRIHAFAK